MDPLKIRAIIPVDIRTWNPSVKDDFPRSAPNIPIIEYDQREKAKKKGG